jgi:hypothetical protein
LFLIWQRCIGGLLTPNDNVTGEAPNFLAAIELVKDEISIVILAACLWAYIMLEPVEYPEEIARGRGVRGSLTGGRLHRRTPEKRWVTASPPKIRVVIHMRASSSTSI